jgi:hypothetical protein
VSEGRKTRGCERGERSSEVEGPDEEPLQNSRKWDRNRKHDQLSLSPYSPPVHSLNPLVGRHRLTGAQDHTPTLQILHRLVRRVPQFPPLLL